MLLLLSSLGSGCGGRYQLGRHAEPPFSTIYIKPVSNESFAPQLHALLTGSIADELARDGLLRLRQEHEADVTLEIIVQDYTRSIAATRPEDTAIAAKLDLDLLASCTLIDNRTGEVYFRNRPLRATGHVYPEIAPLHAALQAERQAMPILAGDLARDISRTILQTW